MKIQDKKIVAFFVLLFLFTPLFSNAQTNTQCPVTADKFYSHPGTNAVWKVVKTSNEDKCTKRPVSSSKVFFTHVDSWDVIKATTKTNMGDIPDDKASFLPWGPKYDPKGGALIKVPNDSKVYLLLDGKKYWITSEKVFNELNYKWDWIQDASKELLSKYQTEGEIESTDHHPVGTLIKYPDSSKVYRIEKDENNNLIKRHIQDEKVFEDLGYRFDRVVTVANTETYPNGKPIYSVKDEEQNADTEPKIEDDTNTAFDEEKVEQLVHQKINNIRKENNLDELSLDSELSKVADNHSKDMAKRDYYSHYTPEGDSFHDRYEQANYTCQNYGAENLGKVQWGVPIKTNAGEFNTINEENLSEAFVQMWMHSPGHKRSILTERWTKQGLGVEKSSQDWVYITQDFC